jgi:glycosyltransferase involved in cell wall biosynthesis
MGRSIRPQDRALVWASMRLLDRWVDAYAVSSETLVPTLLGYGIRRSKLMVLPPAVDTALFQPGDRLAARRRLAIDPSEALVIYLGRPSPRRFPAGAVGAAVAAAAARTARRVRFIALTPGSTFDGSENSAARLLAYRRAATRQLRAVPGLVAEVRQTDLTDADKVAWLRAADAVLLPFSAPEAVEPPLSLLEAMACGALPVVTPAANRSGLIRSGDNGLVYEAPAQLAAVLSDLLERGDGAVLGERARHAVLERHSPAAVAAAANALWARVEHTPGRSTDGPW